MGLIDSILNLASLLLWLNWRAIGFSRRSVPNALSLASTLKRPESRPASRWLSLAALIALLVVRGFFYWHMGSTVGWTPMIDLGAFSLPLRSDYLARMLIYSLTTFGLTLGIFYSGLLLISVVNRRVTDADLFHKLIRVHLGVVENLPALVKLCLPTLLSLLLWVSLRSTITRMGLMPPPASTPHIWEEGILVAVAAFLTWKYLVIGLLALYILSSYVYLGNHPFWNFIAETSRNLLQPLRWIPLSIGKFDFAPMLVIGMVWIVARYGSSQLTWFYQQLPMRWPPF